MNYNDSVDVAARHAGAATKLMDRYGIPANPNNFAIWYNFVADYMPELTVTIRGMVESGQPFDSKIAAELYERFFGISHEQAELREVGSRIGSAISNLLAVLTNANKDVAQYDAALETFSSELTSRSMPTELVELVRVVLDDTKSMATTNHQLEERLHVTSGEITRLRDDLDRLRHEASTDPLTGLANRKMFDVGLQEAAQESGEDGKRLSVLMIDIDFFKQFNDTHGHQTGDQVLKLVSRSLVDSVRESDIVARYGGEEFSVVLRESGLKEAIAIGEKIRATVATRKITNRRTGQVLGQITLSVGCSEYVRGESVGDVLHRADEALYLAKRNGRNRVMSQDDVVASGLLVFDET